MRPMQVAGGLGVGSDPMARRVRSSALAGAGLAALAIALAPQAATAQWGPAHNLEPAPQFRTAPAAHGPNVLIILTDDLGYSDIGAFGSEIATPNLDRLASRGLVYNHFTSTGVCSPTRAALLTGRNHHSVGMGWLAGQDWGYPGYRGELARDAATLPEILKGQGYATMMVGKWHLAHNEDATPSGPFDEWPTGRGFERFWGFLGGETSQWFPDQLVSGTQVIPTPADGSFYLPDALTEHAIEMIRDLRQAQPDKPFFLYYATGAPHAPHHVKPQDRAKYAGRYDLGWDKIREERLARQEAKGLIPDGTKLGAYTEGSKPWAQLTADQKKMYARFQENYAGFIDNIDQNVGRLLDYLATTGELDNTIVIFTADNGASREVGPEGSTNVVADFYHNRKTTTADNLKSYDDVGTWRTHPHYPQGWMLASNTPFTYGKRSMYGGGINSPLIISWPKGIEARGVRKQFHHMDDLAPTLLEALKITPPTSVEGHAVKPMEGVSMAYSFAQPNAPTHKESQYYEVEGQRAFISGDWKIVTYRVDGVRYDAAPWRLYDLAKDPSERVDLAKVHPDIVARLAKGWDEAAARYDVLPVNDNPLLNRAPWVPPSPTARRTHFEFTRDQPTIERARQPALVGREYAISATISRERAQQQGVIVAAGDAYTGWTLFVKDNRLVYENSLPEFGGRLVSETPLPTGDVRIGYRFKPTAPGRVDGVGTLLVNGQPVGSKAFGKPPLMVWEGMDVGQDRLTPVSREYASPNAFDGGLGKVVFDLAPLRSATSGDDPRS
jgi:arylsulfatase A-like enzyme